MRLLNTTTLKLQEFMGDPPHYVILSHTWGEEEVTFDDICRPREQLEQMQGFDKILRSCQLAEQDGFEWIWIDTCCIDKRSSTELSEAINSMYRWYWDAEVCYAYLVDVCNDGVAFGNSRWFKRGWTLQELLAPATVEFYDSSWNLLGSKLSLVDDVERATGISKQYLLHRDKISDASIAARFSWASHRKTTRQEDIAYCLLGLVSVNMPMLYGEKEKAFYRLQCEIVKQSDDHTIFAWQRGESIDITSIAGLFEKRRSAKFGSIFAPGPQYFESSSRLFVIYGHGRQRMTHEVVNSMLRITLPINYNGLRHAFARLNCADERGYVSLSLVRDRDGSYARVLDSLLVFSNEEQDHHTTKQAESLLIRAHSPVTVRGHRDHHFHCMRVTAADGNTPSSMFLLKHSRGTEWEGIVEETLFLEDGDFASLSVSFATAVVGMFYQAPILELYHSKPLLINETPLMRDWDRLRQRINHYRNHTTTAVPRYESKDRRELTTCHHFDGFSRTTHVALQLRKTCFNGQLCWSVKVTTWFVDSPHQGQDP